MCQRLCGFTRCFCCLIYTHLRAILIACLVPFVSLQVGDGLQLSSHLQLLSLSARQIACTVISFRILSQITAFCLDGLFFFSALSSPEDA